MANSDIQILGDVELSGAMSFSRNYSEFPADPKPRTIIVKGGVTYIYSELVDGSGFWSWQPVGLKQTSYLHTQGVASSTWTVNHGFGSNDFAYFVYDADHNLVIANITVVDTNTVTINLSSAMTGTAVFFSIEYVNTQNLRAATSVTVGASTLTSTTAGVLLVDGAAIGGASEAYVTSAVAAEATARDAAIAAAAPDLSGYAAKASNNTFTKAQRGSVVALTYGASITMDMSASNNFSLTATGNFTLANPTNMTPGQSGLIVITQDATGSRVVSWGSNFVAAGGTKPTLSTAANAVDYVSYYVESASRVFVSINADVK